MRCQPHVSGVVIIEDDCWIGANACILSGVTLGRGSVVAAGAVVSRSTKPGSVVGGVPARFMRNRFEPIGAHSGGRAEGA
jgi:acetyltransferase-like isoleucine patch superfamily enzyme